MAVDLTEGMVEFETMRSSGPGGQHANRSATAVRLRVPIDDLPLSDREKEFVREHLPPKNRTKDGELIVHVGTSRSQQENRKRALKTAAEEIDRALEVGREGQRRRQRTRRIKQSRRGGGGGERDIKEEQQKRRRAETTDDLLEEAYEEDPDLLGRYVEEESPDESSDDT